MKSTYRKWVYRIPVVNFKSISLSLFSSTEQDNSKTSPWHNYFVESVWPNTIDWKTQGLPLWSILEYCWQNPIYVPEFYELSLLIWRLRLFNANERTVSCYVYQYFPIYLYLSPDKFARLFTKGRNILNWDCQLLCLSLSRCRKTCSIDWVNSIYPHAKRLPSRYLQISLILCTIVSQNAVLIIPQSGIRPIPYRICSNYAVPYLSSTLKNRECVSVEFISDL